MRPEYQASPSVPPSSRNFFTACSSFVFVSFFIMVAVFGFWTR